VYNLYIIFEIDYCINLKKKIKFNVLRVNYVSIHLLHWTDQCITILRNYVSIHRYVYIYIYILVALVKCC